MVRVPTRRVLVLHRGQRVLGGIMGRREGKPVRDRARLEADALERVWIVSTAFRQEER